MLGLADGIFDGLDVLADLLHPYPWWYWTLVFVLNFPVYFALIYVVFFSREMFRANWEAVVAGYASRTASYHPANIFAGFRFMLWIGLCVTAVIVQHHMLWKRLFNAE